LSEAWIGTLTRHLADWSPDRLAPPVAETTRRALARAVAAKSGWLYHPFVSPVIPGADQALVLDPVQVPAWLAVHSGLGFEIRLQAPTKLVTAGGDFVSLCGKVSSKDLAAAVGRPRAARSPLIPILRPGAATGAPWEEELACAAERIAGHLPRVADWVAGAAKLAGILKPRSGDGFASASFPEVPGYIALTPSGDAMQLLEAVVHETAHLYFFRYESASPLVRPSGRRFASPLRPDPRPLRGILLAMHACAYVSAAFAEAEAAGLDHPARCAAQRREMLALFEEARLVVDSAADLLTARGAAFVARTRDVAECASLKAAA
jgi:hypothetical protein